LYVPCMLTCLDIRLVIGSIENMIFFTVEFFGVSSTVLRFDAEVRNVVRQNVEKITENVEFIRPLQTAFAGERCPPQRLGLDAHRRSYISDSQVG
jgi:hypothetical protein